REPPRQPDGRRSTTRALLSRHAPADQGPPIVRATDHSGGHAIHATRHPSRRARAAATTPARRRRPAGRATARSSSDVGGPDMAPHTPRPSDAPRQSRGAPRRRHRMAHRRDSMAPFLTRVASNAFIPPPSDRLALGPGGSHGTPG